MNIVRCDGCKKEVGSIRSKESDGWVSVECSSADEGLYGDFHLCVECRNKLAELLGVKIEPWKLK